MRKTSVYLTDDEAEGLRRLAVREGRAQAELIREGVRRVIADIETAPRTFRSLARGHVDRVAPEDAIAADRPPRWTSDELYDKAMSER